MQENALVTSFMSMYLYEFKITAAAISAEDGITFDEFISKYGKDIYNYMSDKSTDEDKWVGVLYSLFKRGTPSKSARKHTKFMYYFLLRIYLLDGYSDMNEFKNCLRRDYRLAKSK